MAPDRVSVSAIAQQSNPVFQDLLRQYEQSINKADTALGAKFWTKTAEVSFIHPRGTEYGWSGVLSVYHMFANTFTDRKLRCFNDRVSVYGDAAWLTFEWVFDATIKQNNQPLQTKGRETQIWRKTNQQWQLVHVHYSGLPVTGEGQGF